MKILLDECVPWPIHRLLLSHQSEPVQRCGWTAIKNGELLNLAKGRFDLFITSDQSLRYQQNLQGRQNCDPAAFDKQFESYSRGRGSNPECRCNDQTQ